MRADDTSASGSPPQAASGFEPEPAPRVRFYLTTEFGLLVLILVFGIAFGILTTGFLSPFNLFALGRTAAINIVIGLAMMVVIVSGGLNLAVGAIGVSAAMGCGGLIEVL